MRADRISQQSSAFALAALLTLAVISGGGGVRYGLANLTVQLAALIILGVHRRAFAEFWSTAPFSLRALIGACLLLPIAQLIPLPPGVLAVLPGRQLVLEAHSLAGVNIWFPMSVDPARTLVALLGLILPLTLLIVSYRLSRRQLIWIAWTLVGLALGSVLLGAVQVVTQGQSGLLYPENPMPGVLFGTFANRNSAGLFLVSALALAALLPAPSNALRFTVWRATICLLLITAILLTRSRTAIVLAALPLAMLFGKTLGTKLSKARENPSKRRQLLKKGTVAGLVFAASIAGLLAFAPGRIGDSVDRFDAREDARSYIWEDASYAAGRYWPIGSGMGTFDEVFQLDESLENLTPRRAGRAHNDYLEVAIEAGFFGVLLIVMWLAWMAWMTWRAKLSAHKWNAWSGSAILAGIVSQSLLDYPLRSQAMLGMAAFAIILLLRFGKADQDQEA